MTYLFGISSFILLIVINSHGSMNYFNAEGFIVVLFGTFVVWLMLSPWHAFLDLFSFIKLSLVDERRYHKELKKLLLNPYGKIRDPYGLISTALDLWDLGIGGSEFETLLKFRAEKIMRRSVAAIACIQNLGKYPPAMGMIGTILGIIDLFKSLSSDVGHDKIGLSLAMAMTATLYGLILSNFIIFPLVDRLEANDELRTSNIDEVLKILFTHNKHPIGIVKEVAFNVS
ncbi:MAG: MotA/TolQ/ExbB proton channel family protein [Oligoflexia bacterium]|nr:MotA/TolQ/ExbB proton channel family protein [Oligoflexia bacterium]MBF0365650.1 MotA/TolQ/ExbB proton channel family protein [Oligoflexia bacterium]